MTGAPATHASRQGKKMAQGRKACAIVFTLYFQNIKLEGESGHVSIFYIPQRINDLAKNPQV